MKTLTIKRGNGEMSHNGAWRAWQSGFLYAFYALIIILSVLALLEYPGRGFVYVLFTISANALLYFGFRKNAIFFDTFIGIFFWLGFWLKLTFRVAFLDGQFHEPVGNFDGSGAAFDRALLASSCGIFGLLVASFIREKLFFTYPEKSNEADQEGLHEFYRRHRKMVLSGFVVLFVAVAATNFYFGIYQRGAVPRTILPYGLGGIYSWLLLFGLASVSALILNMEYTLHRKTSYPAVIISLMESFFSNVSLLSRGMILNTGALAYGVFRSLKFNGIRTTFRFWVTSFLIFLVLFGSSVLLVNHIRSTDSNVRSAVGGVDLTMTVNNAKALFLDRWVGMEGIMAVSSYPVQGWDLWNNAWKETYSDNKTSFYDMNLIVSHYRHVDTTKYHYISLPGIVAFCFYPGSFTFLFGCMFMVGVVAAAIEISVFRLGGKNVVLCALLAQVVASRYAHFGYVPAQSYLLFGALYLNLLIIYFSDQSLLCWYKRKAQ
jgi:hypothetical protein